MKMYFEVLIKIHFLLSLLKCISGMEIKEKSYSTSIAGMTELLQTEHILIESVDRLVKELENKVVKLKNLVSELQVENQKGLDDPEKYLYNPLNGYSLIRRLYHDWPNIEVFITTPVGNAHLEQIQQLRHEMPSSKDLQEASAGIHRLQITYDLEPSDMTAGILNGKQYDVQMKAVDSYYMGYYLFGRESYYYSAFWIYTAIMAFEDLDYYEIVDFDRVQIYILYAETLIKQNRPKDALTAIQQALNMKPHDAGILKRRNDIELLANTNIEEPKEFLIQEADIYEMGCRGLYEPSPNMYCIYNTTTSPFLRLAPLKMEILNFEPYMVLYHDIVTNHDIEELKGLARPQLKRAAVYSDDNDKPQVVNTRTAKSSGFNDDASNATYRIKMLIGDMTGFDTNGSEPLQIMNYGVGGHYGTHYDFFNTSDTNEVVREHGDRLATVLIYMSDVEQGGATVFPNIHTAVFPRKGSALMWYNLKNDLQGNWRTLHAACPVLFGSKWVCNKWIRANAQMFRRPCYK